MRALFGAIYQVEAVFAEIASWFFVAVESVLSPVELMFFTAPSAVNFFVHVPSIDLSLHNFLS